MKTFFNEDWRYEPDATQLDDEVHLVLLPIFKKYISMGYSPREIHYLIGQSAESIALSEIL